MTNEKTPEPKKNKEPSEQALLVEYQTCGEAITLHISRYWVVAGMFMVINTTLLGGAASSIILGMGNASTYQNIKWLVLGFGVALILIIKLLMLWGKRVNGLIRIHYHRLQEIEGDLGLSTNLYIDLWDKRGKEVPKEQMSKYNELRNLSRRWPRETHLILGMFGIIKALWVVLIVLAFILN